FRQAAAVALRKIDPQGTRSEAARRAVPELKTALKDKEYWVRQAAADILARINAVESAQPDLNTFSSTAQLKRQEALEVLRSVLQDPDRDLRQAAVEALGRIGDHRVGESLAAALADEDVWVRRASAASLTHLHWEPQTAHAQARWLVESLRWEDVPSLGAAAIPPLLDNLKQIQEPTGEDAPLLAALRELTEAHAGDFGPDELQSLAELAFTVPWASDAERSDPATATLRNDLMRVQQLALEELSRRA
ncbi:MAG TPA: HEAT repeat domain-containing protein, partial [Methylomirabilota bacterium]|nr:HEAT repeat domain-containing protein [Methylomirabilota bacterium]